MTDCHQGPKRVSGWLQSTTTTMHVIFFIAQSAFTTMHVIFLIIECHILHFLCAMRVFEVRASSSSLGYLCVKFRFCGDLHCWASPRRKIAYSLTESINYSITRPAYLMRQKSKLLVRTAESSKKSKAPCRLPGCKTNVIFSLGRGHKSLSK